MRAELRSSSFVSSADLHCAPTLDRHSYQPSETGSPLKDRRTPSRAASLSRRNHRLINGPTVTLSITGRKTRLAGLTHVYTSESAACVAVATVVRGETGAPNAGRV